jgi:hypothetical protein
MSLLKILCEKVVQPDQLPKSEDELEQLQNLLLNNNITNARTNDLRGELEKVVRQLPWETAMYLYVKINNVPRAVPPETNKFLTRHSADIFKVSMGSDPEKISIDDPDFLADIERIALQEFNKDRDIRNIHRIANFTQTYNKRARPFGGYIGPDVPNTDIFLYYEETLRDHILVHFTNPPQVRGIVSSGFKYGVKDPLLLGLTTKIANKNPLKVGGGYNFAFDVDYLPEVPTMVNWEQTKYGDALVFFRANAIKTHHVTDDEEQCIFWGKNAKDIHGCTIKNMYDSSSISLIISTPDGETYEEPFEFDGEVWDRDFMVKLMEFIKATMGGT